MIFLSAKKLRISLKSYELVVLDKLCNEISRIVKFCSKTTKGPIYLPTKTRKYCVLTSPHVNKDAREHFEIRTHKRLFDIYTPMEEFFVHLQKLTKFGGVEVDIKRTY